MRASSLSLTIPFQQTKSTTQRFMLVRVYVYENISLYLRRRGSEKNPHPLCVDFAQEFLCSAGKQEQQIKQEPTVPLLAPPDIWIPLHYGK